MKKNYLKPQHRTILLRLHTQLMTISDEGQRKVFKVEDNFEEDEPHFDYKGGGNVEAR